MSCMEPKPGVGVSAYEKKLLLIHYSYLSERYGFTFELHEGGVCGGLVCPALPVLPRLPLPPTEKKQHVVCVVNEWSFIPLPALGAAAWPLMVRGPTAFSFSHLRPPLLTPPPSSSPSATATASVWTQRCKETTHSRRANSKSRVFINRF